ncbi:hypothetical protein BTHE68_72040 (plasmid) [Burkholderia sp. THE68]|uniref:hypothetical protein n=1 Tax=Burkholderia sp. THE68 TaxID=758782 RepID=UPI001316E448|nr:hypothetical protein [Burkholderia sp. THE68]BBU33470.1 hypothetical protein BTHE68_72040 [Burkholderia sp. THE68]
MSAIGKITDPVKGNASLVRPRFSPGLLLRDDDLNQAIDYTRELSRLLFRTMFGCGVVCGLRVSAKAACGGVQLTVHPGVALDCHGDPIHVPQERSVTLDPSCGSRTVPSTLWIVLRRTDKSCAPRSTTCSCDDDDDTDSMVCTRERDCYEIGVLGERPECSCGCDVTSGRTQDKGDGKNECDGSGNADNSDKGDGIRKIGEKDDTDEKDNSLAATTSDCAARPSSSEPPAAPDCGCADPSLSCHHDHYAGLCACDCCDCTNHWIVLAIARGSKDADTGGNSPPREWKLDHQVRRFVRPVLMRDPVVWEEQQSLKKT